MAGKRDASLVVRCAKKGHGKTYNTFESLLEYVAGLASRGIKPRRGLLVDFNNEFSFVPAIALRDIRRWCDYGMVELRRISLFKMIEDADIRITKKKKLFDVPYGPMTTNEKANSLDYVLNNFHTGAILIEDINRYIPDNFSRDVIGNIISQRHKNTDLIIHFQNIGRFGHPKILANANYLCFHYCSDEVERHSDKFLELTKPLSLMEIIIQAHHKKTARLYHEKKIGENEYKALRAYNIWWDNDNNLIKGDFTRNELQDAVIVYLQRHYRTEVQPKYESCDLFTGKRLFKTPAEVSRNLISEYVEEYYGN